MSNGEGGSEMDSLFYLYISDMIRPKEHDETRPRDRHALTVIVDAGHGGIRPEDSMYMTAGKRSPKFKDGSVLYEGVNNREIASKLVAGLKDANFRAINLVESIPNYMGWADVPLRRRTDFVNELCGDRECLFISIHSNGAGDGVSWHSATGIDTFVHTEPSSKSKSFADIVQMELIDMLGHLTKDRGVKQKNLHVLRETNCPAVLLELGFHTNEEEAKLIQTDEWHEGCVIAIIDAVKEYYDTNYELRLH